MVIEVILLVIEWLAILFVVWTVSTYLFRHRNYFDNIVSRWHTSFHDQHLSSKDVYDAITAAVTERRIPGISFGTANHYQGGMFSVKREYLKIQRGRLMFLVCAAPFGNDYFISYWLGEPISFAQDLVLRLPFIGKAVARQMRAKTYFQMDTENMYLEGVKFGITQGLEQLKASKGIRLPLSELTHGGMGDAKNADHAVDYV